MLAEGYFRINPGNPRFTSCGKPGLTPVPAVPGGVVKPDHRARPVSQFLQELSGGAANNRMHGFRTDFTQGNQDESPPVHGGMGKD